MSTLLCEVRGVKPKLPTRTAAYDLDATPLWKALDALGPEPLSPRILDLLDLSGGVYRVESRIKKRATDPAIGWKLTAPVRDLPYWQSEGGTLLCNALSFLNRGLWTCDFVARPGAKPPILKAPAPREVHEALLFSGGMDSLCGAGIHPTRKDRVVLVGAYHKQASLQSGLARELDYPNLVRWRLAGQRGKEGMNLIRSFMFLTLGAVSAYSFGASRIYQYENGVLGLSIPPAGNFIPTRHAHPETHALMSALFQSVFGRPFKIENPFILLTKREVGANLAARLGAKPADALLDRTETCWFGTQAQVRGVTKEPWRPCGVCTPCIVRRTARPQETPKSASGAWSGYAFDLREAEWRKHPKLGTGFRGYLELIDIVRSFADDDELVAQLAPEARALIGRPPGPDEAQIVSLLRRFALEFCDALGIAR